MTNFFFGSRQQQNVVKIPYTPQDDELILQCIKESPSDLAGLKKAADKLGKNVAGVVTRYRRVLMPRNAQSSTQVHRGRTSQISAPSSTLSTTDSSSLQMATLAKIVDKLNPQNKQALVHYVLNL